MPELQKKQSIDYKFIPSKKPPTVSGGGFSFNEVCADEGTRTPTSHDTRS